MKKNKFLTSAIAVGTATAILFGGTFAWQSISQRALNEVAASVNPGGRLHDDFHEITADKLAAVVTPDDPDADVDTQDETGETTTGPVLMTYDKNVYVENFTEYAKNGVQVFARVRLDEYMELGKGAGEIDENGKKAESNEANPLVPGTDFSDKSTWSTYHYGDEDSAYRTYWDMTFGGSTVYMPTFNKNKDSLEADINGSFRNNFADYIDYSADANATQTKVAIYDEDAEVAVNGVKPEEKDELVEKGLTAAEVIEKGSASAAKDLLNQWLGRDWVSHVSVADETHTATNTLNAKVMSMAEWLELDNNAKIGEFWVYDEDGWAYWAAPIDPETATGLLLDGIQRTTNIINQDWYYAINVVAQFVTGDDLGQSDNTGFYDVTEGTAPTANALLLLNEIGVDVKFEVSNETELAEALAHGGTVALTGDIQLNANKSIIISENTVLNLDGYKIKAASNTWDQESKVWAPISVRGANTTLIINEGTHDAVRTGGITTDSNDCFCVDVREGAKVYIYGGIFVGNISCVYVHEGEAAIYGGNFSIQQLSTSRKDYSEMLNCLDANYANGTAKITVCGGTFENFNPDGVLESTDPRGYVPNGYSVEAEENNTGKTYYTVSKTTSAQDIGADTTAD